VSGAIPQWREVADDPKALAVLSTNQRVLDGTRAALFATVPISATLLEVAECSISVSSSIDWNHGTPTGGSMGA
jgi:hypothetical protein